MRQETNNEIDLLLRRLRRQDTADRKSTRLNSSHGYSSYGVFWLEKREPGSTGSFAESWNGGRSVPCSFSRGRSSLVFSARRRVASNRRPSAGLAVCRWRFWLSGR